jgi:prefoldin subunit 5
VELLKDHRYDDHAALAEEKKFLKDYTVPFVQLDPLKTILVFSHNHNTFDKKKLLENAHPQFFRPSDRKVEDFIRLPKEAFIKQFFMTDIEKALAAYAPGEPAMKPDVLKQIEEIEMERRLAQQQPGGQIMVNEPGKEPRPMTPQEIIHAMNMQLGEINMLRQKTADLETMVANLQKTISKMNQSPSPMKEPSPMKDPPSISSLSPTISKPQDTFVDTLLKKIEALEKRNKELETMPQVKEIRRASVPASASVHSTSHSRSKSMPEVMVDLSR